MALRWIFVAVLLLFVVSGSLVVTKKLSGAGAGSDPLVPDEFVEGMAIPAFTLTDQDEQTVTESVFDGNVTVIDFIFTHCPFQCPQMMGRMSLLAEGLKDTDARFLSFSIDPDRDTPARLKDYGERNGADFGQWTFVTGDRDVTWKIVSEGLFWGIEYRPDQTIDLPDGTTMDNIRHPGWFALIGPEGRVLGIYQSSDDKAMALLERRIRAIDRKLSRG